MGRDRRQASSRVALFDKPYRHLTAMAVRHDVYMSGAAGGGITLIFEANCDRERLGESRGRPLFDVAACPPYKPHATANGDEAREADLSTQQAGAQAPSWLSPPPEVQGGPQGSGRTAAARAQAAQRLTSGASFRVSNMQRLRQRADFLAAAAGARAPVNGFVLQALNRREDGPVRVGFTVSKKVGNAVERNRVRRRLREVVRLSAG